MSCSSNEAAARALSPRLAGALAVSAALHALLAAGLDPLVGSGRFAVSALQPGSPIRAVLRGALEEPPARAHTAAPQLPAGPPAPSPGTKDRSLIAEPHYYLTRELDVPPGIMTRVEPEYPDSPAARGLSGRVVLRLFIGESGEVERLAVLRAEPPGVFDEPAERAFRAARFTPGMKQGRPVRVQMTLEVNFEAGPAR